MKKNKKNTDKTTLSMTMGNETKVIAEFDARKFAIINYYISQKGEADTTENLMSEIAATVVKAFDAEIDRQYKKHVPAQVRAVYENLIIKSEYFGALPIDEIGAALEKHDNE